MTSAASLPLAESPPPLENPYEGYSYSYPHKSAYGPLSPPVPLAPLWQAEKRDALFLYVHIPFCEMRCGFCNLFARAGADDLLVDSYLDALALQAKVLGDATANARSIAHLAVGGGTPTFLSPVQLERLFEILDHSFAAQPHRLPSSVETSPKTATPERLEVLHRRGVERVSIGVQSFVDQETHVIGRPQTALEVHAALERLRAFPVLNIDLIYGQPTQTTESWLASVRAALRYQPEEIYLYPLYVRPNTGIARRGTVQRADDSFTRSLYREARDLLAAEGYEQISMRFFQRKQMPLSPGPVYCCQTDGMMGLGCGARSYTSQLHYSDRFAVESAGVSALVNEWVCRSETDFAHSSWGVRLTDEDRRRRYVIQSLLTKAGLVEAEYQRLFQDKAAASFPVLTRFVEEGLAEKRHGVWRLTALGVEFSDAIGPSLYSRNREALKEFAQL